MNNKHPVNQPVYVNPNFRVVESFQVRQLPVNSASNIKANNTPPIIMNGNANKISFCCRPFILKRVKPVSIQMPIANNPTPAQMPYHGVCVPKKFKYWRIGIG